jgi:hypothetical protein
MESVDFHLPVVAWPYPKPAENPPPPEASSMHTRTLNSVREILLPFTGEMPLHPSVRLNDQVTTAIETMVKHDLQIIPVVWNARPVGQVRLKDAFAAVGIRMP